MSSQYIEPPITTDADDLAQIYFDFVQSQFPNYVPQAGQFATVTTEGWARIAAFVANIFAAMPKAAFRFLGKLYNILPLDASAATVDSTWTVINDSGYPIPAGTQVVILDLSGAPQYFQVAVTVAIPSGETSTDTGAVTLVAITPGAAASGLGEDGAVVNLANVVEYVDTVTLTGPTVNGQDAEDDDTYLNRLAAELKLQSPRPILPDDVAALLQNIAGIDRALVLDNYVPAVNERQTVVVDATAGTFTLTFNTHTTGPLAFNATAATIQTAIEGLTGVGAGQVSVTGGPVNTGLVTVEFTGSLAGTNVGLMTESSASLTGASHTATVALLNDGAPADTAAPRSLTTCSIDTSGAAIGSGLRATALTYLQGLRETTFQFFAITPTYNPIDVAYEITVTDNYDPATVIAACDAAVAVFFDPANWGLPGAQGGRAWIDTPTIRVNDGAAAVKAVQGVQHVESFEICVHGGSPAATNLTMTGPAALPTLVDISGSHT